MLKRDVVEVYYDNTRSFSQSETDLQVVTVTVYQIDVPRLGMPTVGITLVESE